MVKQYLSIKEKHKDAILFFRLGDFYEMFNQDAEVASRELDLVLTGRGQEENRMPMCGIPFHASENYIARLIDKGYKVAICEQVEDPKLAKGVVKREVIRIITPGTVVESNLLSEKINNYLLAITKEKNKFGLAYADASTGEFRITEINSQEQLIDEINRINPSELLVSDMLGPSLEPETKSLGSNELRNREFYSQVPTTTFQDTYDIETAEEKLKEFFKVNSLDSFGLSPVKTGWGAAVAILEYLREAQKTGLDQIRSIKPYHTSEFMFIDATTRRNLELVHTIRDKSFKGSLLWVLDRTNTSMGSRLLRQWVLQPLLDVERINQRLDAVEELFGNGVLRAELGQEIKNISDIERAVGRIASASANARDLIALKESLKLLPKLKSQMTNVKCQMLKEILSLSDFRDVVELISRAVMDDPPFVLREGGLIKEGYDPELDEIKKAAREGKDWIAHLENEERKRSGIKSLKVGFTKVFGYYIEVTKANLGEVPENYIRKQTLVNCERFITPELKEKESLILNADERMKEMEYMVFCEVRSKVAEHTAELQRLAQVLAQIDGVLSLAEVAVENRYCRPQISQSPNIQISESRHPVVEKTLGAHQFVPNNVEMDNEKSRFLLITGPNMAGKCVSYDTLVFTDKGLMNISKFNSPDMKADEFKPLNLVVKGLEGKEKTSYFYKGGMQETIRIRTRSGFVIEGTKKHRIVVRSSKGENVWKRLDEIGPTDYIVIDRNIDLWGNKVDIEPFKSAESHHNLKIYDIPMKMTKDLAYFIGLLIGDGTLTYRECINFSNADKDLIKSFKNICFRLFGKKPATKKNKKDHVISSLYIRGFLEHLGVSYWNSANKEVPFTILQAPKDIVRAFLQGVFDTDGYASKKYGIPSYSTSSYKLAKQIQMLLLNFGLITNFRLKKTKRADNYILSLYGLSGKIFYEKIGFRLKRKNAQERLTTNLRMTNIDIVPYLKEKLLILQKNIVNHENIPSKMKLKYAKKINGIFYSYLRQNRNLSYFKLKELIDYCLKFGIPCNEFEELHKRNYFYDKVTIIIKGRSSVYDFTIPGFICC